MIYLNESTPKTASMIIETIIITQTENMQEENTGIVQHCVLTTQVDRHQVMCVRLRYGTEL